MDAAEHLKKVSFGARGVEDAGITEAAGESPGERGNKNEARHHGSRARAIQLTDEFRHHRLRDCGISPGNRPDDHHAHEKVKDGNDQNRENNGPGDILPGMLNFASEIGDVIVSAVVSSTATPASAPASKT